MWSTFDHSCYALHVWIRMFWYMPSNKICHVPTTAMITSWHIVCLVHLVYTIFLIQFYYVEYRSTTAFLLASKLHKYICLYVTCPGTLCTTRVSFFLSTTCWRLTLTYEPACNFAKSLAHVTSQLLGPTCPLSGPYPFHQRRYYWWCRYPKWCKIESILYSASSSTCTALGRSLSP